MWYYAGKNTGDYAISEWKNSEKHGDCIYFYKNGSTYYGKYKHGIDIGGFLVTKNYGIAHEAYYPPNRRIKKPATLANLKTFCSVKAAQPTCNENELICIKSNELTALKHKTELLKAFLDANAKNITTLLDAKSNKEAKIKTYETTIAKLKLRLENLKAMQNTTPHKPIKKEKKNKTT